MMWIPEDRIERLTLSKRIALVTGVLFLCASSVIAARDVTDVDITNYLERQFRIDEAIAADAVDVATEDGIVTLSGSVDNILAKDRAARIAEATVGVRAVVNRILVIPPITLTDSEIEQAAIRALRADPATSAYDVNITVDNGVVRLTGSVDSWQEKQLCEAVVKGVTGVTDVENHLTIDYDAVRTDFEIEQEIKRRLENDVRVDARLINVDVEDQEVVLTGAVGSVQERNRAQMNARVRGVESVDKSQLEIRWWARDEMRRIEDDVERGDEQIEQAIHEAFEYDPRVDPDPIRVNVRYGRVTLSGVVDNLLAKRAAENNARHTAGVMRVINNIKVRPVDRPDDDQLQERVAGRLIAEPRLNRFDIDVSVYGGVVHLSGHVNTAWEKQRAERLAEEVSGVVDVINNISYDHEWTPKPDWEIKEDLENLLAWSPFVDEENITVTVEDGVVTLMGEVHTYSERQTASDKAYQAGAKDVKNRLTVAHRIYGPHHYIPYY